MENRIDLSVFRQKFVLEAKDRVARMNSGLVYLEKNPGDSRLEGDILREAHTLKGASKMLGIPKVSDLAHRFEEALSRRKDKEVAFNRDLTDALFLCLDTLNRLLDALGSGNGGTESVDTKEVLDRLRLAQVSVDESALASAATPVPRPPASPKPERDLLPAADPDAGRGIRVEQERLEVLANLVTASTGRQLRQAELRRKMGALGSRYRRTAAELSAFVRDAIAQGTVSPEFAQGVSALLTEGTEAFREIGTQLSELRRREEEESSALAQTLEDIRSEVMSIRMVTLSPLFESFRRAVRDLSRELDKDVELLVRGGKTEIDRKVAESMTDPLIHLIRNAVDHGIEPPAARQEAKKPPRGKLIITATPKKGRVVIEVEDDGRGIDIQEIRETAVRKGMITEKAAYRLDDRELLSFVFRPGFTTARQMTDISGRGIGMDVVRATAERFNGTVELFSAPGKGTKVVLELPFTTAVSRILLFLAGGQFYGLPIMHSEGVFPFTRRDLATVEGRRTLRFRDEPVPAVWLSRLLDSDDHSPVPDGCVAILVRHSQRRIALVVDRLEGEYEVVVKDLGNYLGKVPLFMGSTLLGTGEVALLLDVYDLMNAIRLHPETAPSGEAGEGSEAKEILVVDESLLSREMQRRVLASGGYGVETVAGARAALDLLERKRFALVVAAIRMDGMDGVELAERMRGAHRHSDVPVLLVCSREHPGDRERALRAGARGCIDQDDFCAERLAPLIGRCLEKGAW